MMIDSLPNREEEKKIKKENKSIIEESFLRINRKFKTISARIERLRTKRFLDKLLQYLDDVRELGKLLSNVPNLLNK
jgi:hypothetical protein